MFRFIFAYAGAAFGMLALDVIWLTSMAESFYRPQLGVLLADDFRPAPAIAFYALYLFGVVYFACAPALQNGDWRKATLNGAVFGLVAYATYDLTNQATLNHWPVLVTIVDLCWGVFLTATAASAGYAAARRFAG
ncbi:DUF2177 family protein [Methylocystis sp.]|uniref:DUF2177 family protein n=1 Tax=Methylocystis sp. TaxID=1911079 RepID=UPI0027342298|nr:DUF2177 family protein [Methylocystis sp.]MDP3552919.1 DUF2177 family protein [Methylocystis sp.]